MQGSKGKQHADDVDKDDEFADRFQWFLHEGKRIKRELTTLKSKDKYFSSSIIALLLYY